MGRTITLDELPALREQIAAQRLRLVLTNGYFDLLHVGHVRYLQRARALGDLLLVGVNADATARRAKDPRRPIVPQDERAELVAALGCVDYAVVFFEETAEGLVRLLRPEVYAKGGDYGPGGSALPEAAVVESYGGQVAILPLEPDRSTTGLIHTIAQRYAPPSTQP